MIGRLFARPKPRPDVLVETKVTLHGCELLGPIKVGYRSYANNSLLRNVTIGRFCSMGRRCSVGAALHDLSCFSTHPVAAAETFVRDPATVIGNDVWIDDNVVIVAGVTIGHGAVIGAGAIVTRDVAPYTIVAGVPARLMRPRFGEEIARELLASQWWQYGDAAVRLVPQGSGPEVLLEALQRARPTVLEPHFRVPDSR